MTTIANFNKINLEDIRADMNAALKTVGDKYGMAFSIGRITFLAESFHSKLSCVITDGRPAGEVDKIFFEKYCSWYHLRPEDFGKMFTFENDTYKICGIKRSGRRFNIRVKQVRTGKEYKMNCHLVQQLLTGGVNAHS